MQERAQTSVCPVARQVSQYTFGMRTVQADSCLNSEQIDTLFISVGGQEGYFLRGGYFGPEVQNLRVCQEFLFLPPGLAYIL